MTIPENRIIYPALDGLRAIAFLMVFLEHYNLLPWGFAGVNVFFVLSGFLITGILWDTRDGKYRARNFYVRRALRIFPLYYAICLVCLITTPFFHWNWNLLWIAWPLYLGNMLRFLGPSSVSNGTPLELASDAHLRSGRLPGAVLFFGHFWSLCVEEQFYLVWPWIVFSVRSRRVLLSVCALAVLFTPVARAVTAHSAPSWMLGEGMTYSFTPFQLDALLLGGLLALLWRGSHRQRLLIGARWTSAVGLLIAVVYVTVQLRHSSSLDTYSYPPWRYTWALSYIDIVGGALVLCALAPGTFTRVLGLPPLRWLGRISYGAYIFHDIFHFAWRRIALAYPFLLTPPQEAALLGLAATLAMAWLSYRFLELPFLRLKERLTLH